ncbi:MAG: hypothetical protein ACYCW5_01025 [Thermoleophilia bacterium]
MLWKNLKFWRLAAFGLFAAVLVLAYPHLKPGPHFVLEESNMEIVTSPQYGAKFTYTVKNDGGAGGETYVNFHCYLYDRGGDQEDDYETVGINSGETKSGEFFMQLRPGQPVHDWRIELT